MPGSHQGRRSARVLSPISPRGAHPHPRAPFIGAESPAPVPLTPREHRPERFHPAPPVNSSEFAHEALIRRAGFSQPRIHARAELGHHGAPPDRADHVPGQGRRRRRRSYPGHRCPAHRRRFLCGQGPGLGDRAQGVVGRSKATSSQTMPSWSLRSQPDGRSNDLAVRWGSHLAAPCWRLRSQLCGAMWMESRIPWISFVVSAV